MIEIKGKAIMYTIEEDTLANVNPYLFSEPLAQEINNLFPFLRLNKMFASKKQTLMQIYCLVPSHYTLQQINLIKIQIELLSSNLLAELKDKIYFAGLAS